MMSDKEYFKFSRKVFKLLRTCFLFTKRSKDEVHLLEEEFGLSASEVTFINGASSLTENYIYCFNISEALKHKDELLDICAALPKLKDKLTGTAGTISYADLLTDRRVNINELTKFCELADKFIGLLTINGIGFANEISGTGSFKAAPIDLAYKYIDRINPEAVIPELIEMNKEREPMRLRDYAERASNRKNYMSVFELSQEIINHSHSKNHQKAFAYTQLAELYEYGRYVKQNFKKAAEYYGKAIECGDDFDDIKIKYHLYQMDNYDELFKEKREIYLKYSPDAPEEALYGLIRKAIKAELDREGISKLMK